MKKSKILAPALAVLCLSVAASVTGTVAWFAANNVVTASGMTVKSTLPSSLAISGELPLPVGKATSVDLTADSVALNPASHWHGEEDTDGGLWRVNNGEKVDPATGLALAGETLTYIEADSAYYKDFTVYIGSVGQALVLGAGGYLRAQVTFTGTVSGTNLATSMDFYAFNGVIAASDLGDYKGVVNAAGTIAADNHGLYSGVANPSNYVDVLTTGTIPVASDESSALKITMRVYIDGALQNDEASTYVATNSVISNDIIMAVSFSLNRG